jgi:CheY-like chemotaxis protein
MMADNAVLDAEGMVDPVEHKSRLRLRKTTDFLANTGECQDAEERRFLRFASDARKASVLASPGSLELAASDDQTPDRAAPADGKRILLVDDDDGYRYAAQRALEGAGFAVVAARGFNEALEVLDGLEPIDLLVIDIVMKVNGFALARMARYRRPKLKTLYITAFDVPADEAAGKLIRKPAVMDELVREVHAAIAGDQEVA